MSAINDGGNAFPIPGLHNDESFNGMSLRDYFAAKAMQGICANNRFNPSRQIGTMASESYLIADAMLKAREAIE